jgi:hypothetical protein
MDERIHEHSIPSNAAFPSTGPTTLFVTATYGCFAKTYSTPRCDEYPIGDNPSPTKNGAVSKLESQSTWKLD